MDDSPIERFLLKFDVAGINGQQVMNAKLCLYNTDAASAGGNFYHVNDDSWQEETITWNTAPAADTNLLASLGAVSINTWYDVDVTSLITGDGAYSLRISDSNGGADYSSKEGTNPPQLVITLGGTPAPTATATPSQTPTPGPSPTPTNTPTASQTATSVATATPTATATAPAAFNSATFVYDGDGRRVKSTINGVTTTFIGSHYEVTNGVVTKYYYAGSQRIAMRINGTLNYLLGDHLGSTSVVTDASGNILSEQRYYPFGETRLTTGTIYTDRLFTGQREVTGLGIYHFNARFYSPKLGRFLSPDTIVPNPISPQAFNRYSYTLGNPLRYTDPSGHRVCDDVDSAGNCITAPGSPAGGTGNGGGGNGGRDDDPPPPGHSYDNLHNEPNLVCLDLSWINCTDAEVEDYLSSWQYPGQLFWNPVQDRGRYNVFPEKLGNIPTLIGLLFPGSGAIRVEFGDHRMTNVARPSHVFYEGYVERSWSRTADGVPQVRTHGEGTNDGFGVVPGHVIDEANDFVGPYAFEALDFGLVVYTTVVETGQYISSLWP